MEHTCKIEMKKGLAFQNTPSMSVADFAGHTTDSRGQTICFDDQAKLIEVWKCPECGFSRGHLKKHFKEKDCG